jgi:hypothetical protein
MPDRDPTLPTCAVLLFARVAEGGYGLKGIIAPAEHLNGAREIADAWVLRESEPGRRYAAILEYRLVERIGPDVIDLGHEGAAIAHALAELAGVDVDHPEGVPHA